MLPPLILKSVSKKASQIVRRRRIQRRRLLRDNGSQHAPLRGDYRTQFRPFLTRVSILPFSRDGLGREKPRKSGIITLGVGGSSPIAPPDVILAGSGQFLMH